MSQHLEYPRPLGDHWMLLPHDALHGITKRHSPPSMRPFLRLSLAEHAAALLMAVPAAVAMIAGAALAIAPIA